MIKKKFQIEKENKTFRRIDIEHRLDIFIGYNEKNNPTMIVTLIGKEKRVSSSKSIDVNIYKKNDNEIRIVFSLLDRGKESIFYKFCEDIIESTRNIELEKAFNFIITRWNEWRFMFKRPSSDILTENQIVGLMAELIFLEQYMFNKYGVSESITSWQGPSRGHKDYEISDTWYEIKSVRQAALTVKISSIEQLDSTIDGNLEVIFLEKSNKEAKETISLNKLIEDIGEKIENFESYRQFNSKLMDSGYSYNDEYDNYVYRFIKKNSYLVGKDFPRVKLKNLEEGIVKVSYDILLKDIERFIKVCN